MAKKKKHTLLKVASAATVTAAAAYSGASYLVFRYAFDAANSPYLNDAEESHPLDEEKAAWFEHSDKEDEFIDSFDGLKLHALKVRNHPDGKKWAIVLHGIGTQARAMLPVLWEFDHRGFNVLACDLRGFGMSEGKYSTLGWLEHYDLINWINQLISEVPDAEIVLYGLNLGAAAVINAAGDYIPPQVKCAVEDGSWSGMEDVILHMIRMDLNVDGRLVLPGVDLLAKNILHFAVRDIDMHRQLKQASVPMLFTHGEKDPTIPASMLFDCYYACASEKDLYVDNAAGFNETERTPEYWNTVFGFTGKYISENED